MPDLEIPRALARHLRSDEQVAWWGRPSRLGLAPALVFFLVGVGLGVPSLVLFLAEPSGALGVVPLVGGSIALGALGRGADQAQAVLFTTYVLTDQRVVSVRSLVTTTTNSVPLDRVSAIERSHGVVEHLVDLASVTVSAYGSAGTSIRVPALEDADRLVGALAEHTVATATPRWLLRGD